MRRLALLRSRCRCPIDAGVRDPTDAGVLAARHLRWAEVTITQ